MKNILGLDLGTNSIGWAIVNASDDLRKLLSILGAGSRIIPTDAATINDFNKGSSISKTAERTGFRGTRTLIARRALRRERLLRTLANIGFLPKHFADCLDRYGKFKDNLEPKLAWTTDQNGKYQFLFKDSFNEMVSEMKLINPSFAHKPIPYDWTIFYLRKKALTQKISREELAWILLQFNQKRGYFQFRDDDDSSTDKLEEYHELKVIKVEETNDKKGNETWYNIHLENGWIYHRKSKEFPKWEGLVKPFIVTTALNKDGSVKYDKEGNVKRSFRSPGEDDWALIKKKSEHDIDASTKTIGAYIYDALCSNPDQKIRGGLVRIVDRKYYKDELTRILKTQIGLHPELQDRSLFNQCIQSLYNSNIDYRTSIQSRDFLYLFINDILFYQRPLKSCKHLISDCQYEYRFDHLGNKHGVKCIPKSHPLYAEFRIWQFIYNLRIYRTLRDTDSNVINEIDVTS